MEVLRKAFNQELDAKVSKFVSSIEADEELIQVDIRGSLAHAAMLEQCGLISKSQHTEIKQGLEQIAEEARAGKFSLNPAHEDVHMNVEKRLEEIIGKSALCLHTARSRNDQVALDLRLFAHENANALVSVLGEVRKLLVEIARKNVDTVMPGYTHLQRAQPVSFAHVMLAFSEALTRDVGRFQDASKHAKVSPLGAGAQAGTSLGIDPSISARHLGFEKIFANSIDAVSDRDFVADFLFAASMTSIHLSQIAETLIIWSSREFGFVEFADSVTTTSSLMPQKKNPDPLELIRGKAGTACGELVNIMMILKGLPLGYNRDLQETKPPIIRVAHGLKESLEVLAAVLANMSVVSETMLKAASDPDMMSTDLVEYLVRKGVAFRQAHDILSQVLKSCRERKKPISKLTLDELQSYAPEFNKDVFELFDPIRSMKSKTSHGSTGSAAVSKVLQSHSQLQSD
jgi:argininosuccinate lyase